MITLDIAAIRSALVADVPRVLESHGVRYQRRGRELRTRMCPACGQRSRDAVCLSTRTGAWCCKVCGARGGILDALAGYAGIDAGRDFKRVLELGAQLAGIGHALDPETERRIAERRRIEVERAAREDRRRAEARARMPAAWEALDRRSDVGEQYLQGRGIDPAALHEIGDVVRYTGTGEPAVALRDLATGEIVGVQRRQLAADADPKVKSWWASPNRGAALYGRLAYLDPDGVDVAVLVEGLADTLAACLAYPTCAVYGSPGASALAEIAAALAPRVRECRGWLLVVPHDDEAGIRAGVAGVKAAQAAGLVLDRDLLVVDLGEHQDLADAWRAGWRGQWPTTETGGAA